MYFKIAMGKAKSAEEKLKIFMDELKSKPEITLYIWLDLGNGSYENIGYVKFSLKELLQSKEIENVEKQFFDFTKKKRISYNCKVAQLQKKVISAIVPSSNTRLYFSFWFMPMVPGSESKLGELANF